MQSPTVHLPRVPTSAFWPVPRLACVHGPPHLHRAPVRCLLRPAATTRARLRGRRLRRLLPQRPPADASRGDGLPGPTDTWTTLAGLARETSTIRLGTLVTSATFRHPGMLALQVAQVDVMSGGRVELGLGAGWFDGEHEAFGLPFPSTQERFERLEEQLEILRGTLDGAHRRRSSTGPESTTSSRATRALPKSVQQPHPAAHRRVASARRRPRGWRRSSRRSSTCRSRRSPT